MLDPGAGERQRLWARLIEIIEGYAARIGEHRVAPPLDPEAIRARLAAWDFGEAREPLGAVEFAAEQLWERQVHTSHPRYYGLFNPAPTTMGVAGDLLTAAFNPQIAAWSHSPFAAEVERHLVRAFGERFGWAQEVTEGAFCSGGAEANHTALVCALTDAFAEYPARGVRGLAAQPVFYASAEAHHSFIKAAGLAGIGREALRSIPVDDKLRMRVDALDEQIAKDRAEGFAPFLVIATAGTTNAGAVDPIGEAAEAARRHGLWVHVDAAWGGAAALSPRLRSVVAGIEQADSITFDAHKWLSVPMGAGLFLTRRRGAMKRTFATPTAYMPKEAAGLDIVDPHLHTMQWSRRFIGLKVFLSLAVAGWDGYARAIDHMTDMGDLLRRRLGEEGWRVVNDTPLPVVCFADAGGRDAQEIVNRVVGSGEAWISTTRLAGGAPVIRACITNYRTGPEDVEALVASLGR